MVFKLNIILNLNNLLKLLLKNSNNKLSPLKAELLLSGKRFIILFKSCEAFIPFDVKNKGKFNLFC